ncbi:C-C motif chemokine 2-like [Sparus aurata]|uniref:C-C motif chemokine 2-like n=1 Tax=Sparus aurata TaxID=8175 RepID=UPI0011C1CE53|nr:C-C motif chemokine 2-like [Sparus aurata]
MPFSIRCGHTVVCLTTLLFLIAQVHPQCFTARPRGTGLVSPDCCMKASKHAFNEPVTACFEQKKNTFPGCGVHAYIFRTTSNSVWCADPEAWWIPQRLKRLEQRGICCQIL